MQLTIASERGHNLSHKPSFQCTILVSLTTQMHRNSVCKVGIAHCHPNVISFTKSVLVYLERLHLRYILSCSIGLRLEVEVNRLIVRVGGVASRP